ncbi:hypothetical protein VTN02DRAFT_1285 [Thermoascus thermophilus]
MLNSSISPSGLRRVLISVIAGIWRIVRNSRVVASTNIHRRSRSRPCVRSVVWETSNPRQDLIGRINGASARARTASGAIDVADVREGNLNRSMSGRNVGTYAR